MQRIPNRRSRGAEIRAIAKDWLITAACVAVIWSLFAGVALLKWIFNV